MATLNLVRNKNYYFYSILLFAFLLPLSRAAVSFFIVMLPLMWMFQGDLKDKFVYLWENPLARALSFFLGFTTLSLVWSQNFAVGLDIVRLYGYWLAGFVIMTSLKKEQVRFVISAFLYGMLVSEIIAYGVFFEVWSFKNATVENPVPNMFWIDYSVFLALTSIILLNRIFSEYYEKKEKVFFFFFFLSTTGNLFLGYGRTGQLALFIAIVVMGMLYVHWNRKSLLYLILTVLLTYTAAYNLSNTFQKRVHSGIKDVTSIVEQKYDNSWGIRVVYWFVAYDILKENPLLGVGVGDFESAVIESLQKNDYGISKETKKFMEEQHAHNQFLMVLIQTGLLGLLLMLYIIYKIVTLPIDDQEVKRISILFCTVYFVSCFAEPLWFKQFTLALFVVFVGVVGVWSRKNEN